MSADRTSNQQCTRYAWLECPDSPADQCSICPKIKEPISEERLRNTRAWAAARTATLSGADVIVRAIDELLARRSSGETTTERCGSGLGYQGQFLRETQCTLLEGHSGPHQYASDPRQVKTSRDVPHVLPQIDKPPQ